ncbi:TPA: hypothetical protein QC443_005565 [Bacillus cereus]|uniref:hypothetical protein n=1 Tax=Bacillus cereus TaxID=1396 RepID=UPI001F15AF9F|nr:hypothetical protein [Bacillus cereus]BCC56681.1 hypothetical protein BCJMU07_p83 [Bacillus cereus]HDR8208901.1 hypothetical protein [Bacillus cereus]HDR8214943.1 hypothetical protein [Bacillus cereus]HDR8227200.1 hypothetical protein [Bacillus cereus]HDR8239196.1 hypothetical protein [Bacillus cereus]
MGLIQESKLFYIEPTSFGDVGYQEKYLGLSLKAVNQRQFLEDVFGDFSGYLCIFQKRSDGKTANTLYKKDEEEKMGKFLKKTFGQDTYISYSTYFSKDRIKRRTQDNIVHTYMIVQDLDYYKYGMSDKEFLEKLGEMIRSGEIICPSYVISTGQGYQLIWLVKPFKNISGYTNDKDWHTIQEFLYQKLKEFNSDSVVKNPSAVTRLPMSKHRKTGNVVYGFKANEVRLDLKDFMFFYNLVPTPDRLVKPKKKISTKTTKSVTRIVSNWNEFTLNRYREEDIFIFVQEQNKRGVTYIGIRNWMALVLRFHALVSTNGDKKYAKERVLQLCSIMDMTDTNEEEILRRSEPSERYYDEWVNDTWDKNKYMRGGLFYTNSRMLELMNIKEDYYMQWKMNTIKVKTKKYDSERKRFERVEKGQTKITNETLEAEIVKAITENPKLGAEKIADIVREKIGKCSKSKVLKMKKQMEQK